MPVTVRLVVAGRARADVLRNSVVLGWVVLTTARAFRICRVCGY